MKSGCRLAKKSNFVNKIVIVEILQKSSNHKICKKINGQTKMKTCHSNPLSIARDHRPLIHLMTYNLQRPTMDRIFRAKDLLASVVMIFQKWFHPKLWLWALNLTINPYVAGLILKDTVCQTGRVTPSVPNILPKSNQICAVSESIKPNYFQENVLIFLSSISTPSSTWTK
jgi:hypothetical protein